RVDGGDFMVYLHGNPEAFPEAFRSLQGKVIRICNHIAYIIWQTTVCISISGLKPGTYYVKEIGHTDSSITAPS
ncbi:MAG: hypothetical protein UEP57_12395, partial [Oscillospiraceae bacterium]|nr:hypothetical protein [Oscillospiraceae bacterium]